MSTVRDSEDAGVFDVAEFCFTARALAQTHPMTENALRYRQERFATERATQPVSELADWASNALLVGYCVRRAEEQAARATPSFEVLDHRTLEGRAAELAVQLSEGEAGRVTLLATDDTIAALDRIIATELEKRREHLREQLDDEAWSELEDYVTWWVVHGYCVRAAETVGQ